MVGRYPQVPQNDVPAGSRAAENLRMRVGPVDGSYFPCMPRLPRAVSTSQDSIGYLRDKFNSENCPCHRGLQHHVLQCCGAYSQTTKAQKQTSVTVQNENRACRSHQPKDLASSTTAPPFLTDVPHFDNPIFSPSSKPLIVEPPPRRCRRSA